MSVCGAEYPENFLITCERESGNHPEHGAFAPAGEHTWIGKTWPNDQFKAPLSKGKKGSTKLAQIVQSLRGHETTR